LDYLGFVFGGIAGKQSLSETSLFLLEQPPLLHCPEFFIAGSPVGYNLYDYLFCCSIIH
jgi:hypothetical protein